MLFDKFLTISDWQYCSFVSSSAAVAILR